MWTTGVPAPGVKRARTSTAIRQVTPTEAARELGHVARPLVETVRDSYRWFADAGVIRLALKRTALFKWKLVQIAKKFGAIDPDADYEKISIYRLLEFFDNTIVQQEAYRDRQHHHVIEKQVRREQQCSGWKCRCFQPIVGAAAPE